MKLFLFLRSIVWSSVLALVFIVASIVLLFVAPSSSAPSTLAILAVATSILSLLQTPRSR